MKRAKTTGLTLLAIAMAIGMASTATAITDDDDETSDVNVTVQPETVLDVKPDQLDYTDVKVGERKDETSNDINYTKFKVENTGSNDIQRIWADSTYPSDNPFGSGTVTEHDAGNFLQIAPYDPDNLAGISGSDTFHYIERVEFFQDSAPLVDIGGMNGTYSDVEVGRIRFGNNEFYYALGHDGAGSCQEIRVADNPTVPSSLGTNDFSISNSGAWTNYTMSSSGASGYEVTNESVTFDLDGSVDGISSGETQDYDILGTCGSDDLGSISGLSEEHIRLVRYNIDPVDSSNLDDSDGGNGEVVEEIWDTSGSGSHLNPGQSFSVNVSVMVPRGIPDGEVTEGTLTVYSQATSN